MATKRKTSYERMAARVKALGVSRALPKQGATRRKNAGARSMTRETYKFIDSSNRAHARAALGPKLGPKRQPKKKRNAGSSLNLHSIIKWGIIAGVGYFLFTKFVKPNLSTALSGIVNDPQMSWSYIDPSKMLQAQEGNPMGQQVRNRPITVGRGVM